MTNHVLRSARKKFILLILASSIGLIVFVLGTLQIVNITSLNSAIDTTELRAHISEDEAVSSYVDSQKPYEAHFVSLANTVRNQDSKRLTATIIIVAITASVIGALVSVLGVRAFMKPVEEAYQSQERFMQDAAHELRNPLAALTASVQEYHRGDDPERVIATVRRQTRRLVSITEDLLYLERSRDVELVDTDLSILLQDVIEELQPLAGTKRVRFETHIAVGIKKSIVSSDYVRMAKNVIDNAVKYSLPQSSVHVTQVLEKSQIVIEVKDSGIGIPADQLNLIGERFFRASNVGTVDGTGLGIAIVRKIARTYGGSVEIKSTPKKGTAVCIRLPH